MNRIQNLAVLFFCCSLCCPGLLAQESTVNSVEISVGVPGAEAEFLLFRLDRDQCVFRSVQSSTAHRLQLSDFRSCKTSVSEEDLISEFLHFTRDLKEAPFDSVNYYDRGPLTMEICYSTGTLTQCNRIYFPQVDPSFFVRAKWEKVDQRSIEIQKSVMGDRTYDLLSQALDFSSDKSNPWVPKKCLLNIVNLKPGVFENAKWRGNVWNRRIDFDEKVRILSASMIIDYDSNFSRAPFGIINTGEFNGFYEITTLPFGDNEIDVPKPESAKGKQNAETGSGAEE